MNSVHFKPFETTAFSELPSAVLERFFPKVIARSETHFTADTPVSYAQIDWDKTDEPVMLRTRMITQKTGRGDFLPTLVSFATPDDKEYWVMVDFGSGHLMLEQPLYSKAELEEAIAELVGQLIMAEETGRAMAQAHTN